MLRGYRLAIAAALGCLSLVGTAPAQEAKTPDHKGEAQSDAAKRLDRITAAIEKQGSGPSPDAGCREGKDDRQSDLCAQWKAADAAYDGQRWSWWQMVISGVGLILGAVTMGAAIAAAVYAKRAAVATEAAVGIANEAAEGASEALAVGARSATAAVDMVTVSRDTAKRQLRAYITIKTVQMIDSHQGFWKMQAEWENVGQTPAKSTIGCFRWGHGNTPLSEDFDFPPQNASGLRTGNSPLGAGQTTFTMDPADFPKSLALTASEDGLFVYAWGWMEYFDIFDEPHRTECAYQLVVDRGDAATGLVFAPLTRHNGMDDGCMTQPSYP